MPSDAAKHSFETQREGCDDGRWRLILSPGRRAWAVVKAFICLLRGIGDTVVRQQAYPVVSRTSCRPTRSVTSAVGRRKLPAWPDLH